MPSKLPLPANYPTAIGFLDETGSIADDRFFAVGLLVVRDPAPLLRSMQRLRDREHAYHEIKWANLTEGSLALLQRFVELVPGSGARFAAFVADRDVDDPI